MLYEASDDPEFLLPALFGISAVISKQLAAEGRYKTQPLEPLAFLGPAGLDKLDVVWPKVVDEYLELCTGKYMEAVMTGGIGTAKTFLAVYALLYETHKLCCLYDPHSEFGLDPASDIVMVFQSVTAGTARAVDYEFFRSAIDSSPWFQAHAKYDRDLKSVINFDNGVVIKPVNSLETAAIGQNVIGGLIDEINFYATVQSSKRSVAGEDVYDQAQANYNAISRRRESRFMEKGKLPGLLCLVSSTRYPGQFTDRKIDRAKADVAKTGESNIFVYQKRVWEVKPGDTFTGKWFKVYIGDRNTNPFIVPANEYDQWEDSDPLIDVIPEEYRHSFEDDIYAALRDIAGQSTQTQHSFFTNMEKLGAAFGHHGNIFNVGKSDFVKPPLSIRPKLIQNPGLIHFAHVDLGAVSDSAGLCIGHVKEFVNVQRTNGVIETLPFIIIDGIIEIPPPRNGEINFEKIRTIFYRCRELGMNLKWVSYDSWQSRDSLQILKNTGFTVGAASIDKNSKPYDCLKTAINDGRIEIPEHAKCEDELRGLQWLREKDKVDHMPMGSKDCADALAGVVWGLTMRRELWVKAGVSPKAVVADDAPDDEEAV